MRNPKLEVTPRNRKRRLPEIMAKLLSLVATLAVVGAHAGIYPDDHWSYSTKLTVDAFDDHVKQEVDAGRPVQIAKLSEAIPRWPAFCHGASAGARPSAARAIEQPCVAAAAHHCRTVRADCMLRSVHVLIVCPTATAAARFFFITEPCSCAGSRRKAEADDASRRPGGTRWSSCLAATMTSPSAT